MFGRDGKIGVVGVAANDVLPTLQACTKPRLAATDAKVTKSVIGHHLSFGDFRGNPQDAGEVIASNIKSTTLIVYREWKPDRITVTVRLAYAISVHRKQLPWTFIVDADTGELVAVKQQFSTCSDATNAKASPVPGRTMARTGLRMMPTSPSSSLKFRTAGFPVRLQGRHVRRDLP
jgi:hypothetical protein